MVPENLLNEFAAQQWFAATDGERQEALQAASGFRSGAVDATRPPSYG